MAERMTMEPVKSGISGRLNALFSLRKSTSGIHPDEEKHESGRLAKASQGFTYKERASPYGLHPRTWKDVFACHQQKSVAHVVRDPTVTMSRRSMAVDMEKDAVTRRAKAIQRVVEDDDGVTLREYSLFYSARDDTLFTQSWTPVSVKVRGVVLLLHGLNEHSGRYNDFAKQLNANGFKVYGMDWIGHGGSDGLHGYVHSLDYAVADMKMFLRKILVENDGLPCFCFGHSTGGAIVLKAVLDPEVEDQVAGIILTSPAVGVQPSHPIFVALAPVMSFLLPKYQVKTADKKGKPVCRDPEALVAKYSDPLVYTGPLRVRTGYEIIKVTSYLQQNMDRLKVPFIVLHGTDDTLTDPKASKKLYDEASTDKTIRLFEGLLHDLLFEPEREAITDDIIQWLNCTRV